MSKSTIETKAMTTVFTLHEAFLKNKNVFRTSPIPHFLHDF